MWGVKGVNVWGNGSKWGGGGVQRGDLGEGGVWMVNQRGSLEGGIWGGCGSCRATALGCGI